MNSGLNLARPDGFGFNDSTVNPIKNAWSAVGELTFQGVRAYDSTTSQWTSPDFYAGNVNDPGSRRPFMWNGNNPLQYSDPSGYDPLRFTAMDVRVSISRHGVKLKLSKRGLPRAAFVAAAGFAFGWAGGKVGRFIGKTVGGMGGEVVGAAAGTLVEPVGGTAAGAVTGAMAGTVAGGNLGAWAFRGAFAAVGVGLAGAVYDRITGSKPRKDFPMPRALPGPPPARQQRR